MLDESVRVTQTRNQFQKFEKRLGEDCLFGLTKVLGKRQTANGVRGYRLGNYRVAPIMRSQQMDNGASCEGSVNIGNCSTLVFNAQQYLAFLQKLHTKGVSLERPTAKLMERYVDYWLPLVAKGSTKSLLPPPDLAWIWLCHRLSSGSYEAYVLSRFGKLVEPNAPFAFQDKGEVSFDARSTRSAWAKRYPDEPFFPEEGSTCDLPIQAVGGFDLVNAALRQRDFLWHVSRPSFQDPDFLVEGECAYYKFLKLKGEQWLMQSFQTNLQISLLWQTHILMSAKDYCSDCILIRGRKLDHEMTMNIDYDVALDETAKLWEGSYGERYAMTGVVRRGEPPRSFYYATWMPAVVSIHESTVLSPLITGTLNGGKAEEPNLEEKWTTVLEKWNSVKEHWKSPYHEDTRAHGNEIGHVVGDE